MPRLSVWMVRAALLHLGTGFTVGGLLLFNKGEPFDTGIWALLQVHVDLLIFGWIMQLAMGVAYWILPRFAQPPKYGRTWLAALAFGLINAGTLISAGGQWAGSAGWTLVGRAAILLAGLCFAVYVFPRVKPMEFVTPPGR